MKAFISQLLALLLVAGCSGTRDFDKDSGASGAAGAEIAAGVPDTEIYLAELSWQTQGPVLGEPRNITQRPGYDNQPRFMPDGRSLVYSSIRDGLQSDVYRYLISENQTVAYALTAESEYSPTPMPGQTGVSVVRVEADGSQRLWRLPAANAEALLLFPDIKGVGYHAWLSNTEAALFIVAEPSQLLLADLVGGQQRRVTDTIGRSLARIPGENALAFIDKQDAATWRVGRYDLETSALAELIDTPPGSEDFASTPAGGLFMGDGAVLRYWDGRAGSDWQMVADLSEKMPGRITRLDVSPDSLLLAFVIAPKAVQ